MPRAYGYCRVSTESQAKTGLGLEAQQDALRRYYQYKLDPLGFTWGEFFIDPAVSGSIPLFERDAGAALNARLQHGDAVLFAKLDRGFRKFVDFAQVFQDWRERQVAIHLIAEGIDLSESNPMGKAMAAMMAVFAELEWDRSCERSREAMAIRKKQGKALNGFAGYGFQYIGPKEDRRRIPDTHERAVMAQIVQMRLGGATWEEMYWDFQRDKITTREGKEWSLMRIRRCYVAELMLRAQEETAQLEASKSPPATSASA